MRGLAPLAFALALGAVLVAGGGCEAIVSNEVPQFQCTGVKLSACPAGQYCNGSGCKACEPRDLCDGYDNDCNGFIDDGAYSDHDDDKYPVCGFRDPKTLQFHDQDCDDFDPNVHPGAQEVCDGKDNDCDGVADEGDICPAGQVCDHARCKTPAEVCTPTSCPQGQVCDTTTGKCGPPPTVDLGGSCTSNTQCNSQLCGDSSTLGGAFTGSNGNVCTSTCCTSTDCPTDFVCMSPGTGGNYCVKASALNRTATGSGAPGAGCASGRDCRSGLCASGHCIDSCCSDRQCTNGTQCTLSNASGANVFQCAPGGGDRRQNDSCNHDSDCTSGICYNYGSNAFPERHCLNACCGSQGCGTVDFGFGITYPTVCYDITSADVPQLGNAVVPVCIGVQNAGTSPLGGPCKSNSDCRSDRCNATEGKCTDVCCTDADCAPAGASWKCRPQQVGSGMYLRCQPVP